MPRNCVKLQNFISQIMFQSYGSRQGPMHGLPISTPYVTKDYLQQKRFLVNYSHPFIHHLRQFLPACVLVISPDIWIYSTTFTVKHSVSMLYKRYNSAVYIDIQMDIVVSKRQQLWYGYPTWDETLCGPEIVVWVFLVSVLYMFVKYAVTQEI